MKKLLTSLAAISLMTGSLSNVTAFVNQKTSVPKNPVSSAQATNEDAEDIANKIWNKTVKIDPNFWLNKDIKSDQTDFNKALVKDGIITQDEVQYISWGSFKISKAGWFANQGAFTVSKDGATASGHVTVDATGGETTAQIASKITKANVKFNFTYWNQKAVGSYLSQVQAILANEKILTKAEASVVTGLQSPVTITKAGAIVIGLQLNNNKTSSDASAHINVVNDGKDVEQVMSSIGNSINLKTNTVGSYADNTTIEKYATSYINNVWSGSSIDNVTLAHQLIATGNNNVPLTIVKDGQAATRTFSLYSEKTPTTTRIVGTEDDVKLVVNLNSVAITALKKYFQSQTSPFFKYKPSLQYFFNLLDDGKWSNSGLLPKCDNFGFADSQTLDPLISGIGDTFQSSLDKVLNMAEIAGNKDFYNALNNYINGNVANATIMFDIHFEWPPDNYFIHQYSFW